MHPFIHPLSEAVQPLWESKTDWEIYKGIAKKFTEIGGDYLGTRKDIVLQPLMHDTPGELGQAFEPKDWKKGECDLIPGKTAPSFVVVERNYKEIYKKFTSIGPLLDKLGNGGKGINWNTEHEVHEIGGITKVVTEEGVSKGRPRLETAIDACEMILTFAPETNGHVSVKAWDALSKITGRDHTHLAVGREHDKIRFRDVQAQPRKIISAPTWSGLESEEVSYNAGYTNVHELIPWRTLTGRQQFYQDHRWMLDFGEGLCVYKPAIDTKTVAPMLNKSPNGEKEIVLNWITPHQKWGIHSTYSDNLRMLTLSRGGPHVWVSEIEAKEAGLVDNDWVEVFNITRAVLKPTHMIGGYAQQAYGFNYYGTVGSNRDEFVPGIGYPKEWENQAKWKGGWHRNEAGKLEPKQGGKLRILANIFANPNLPQIDDYYEPFTYDYERLQNAPLSQTPPTARPISVITGKKMDKIVWGPNWEDDLGGEFSSPVIAEARKHGIPESWIESAQKSPVYKMAMEWKIAFPLHPEYRTLPMV
eukprot:gene34319-biopygen8430